MLAKYRDVGVTMPPFLIAATFQFRSPSRRVRPQGEFATSLSSGGSYYTFNSAHNLTSPKAARIERRSIRTVATPDSFLKFMRR
jgi:hypothetical protein